jgi:hypothetical protein
MFKIYFTNEHGEARSYDEVLVRLDGSIYPTDNINEHDDYNDGGSPGEVFILANAEWE